MIKKHLERDMEREISTVGYKYSFRKTKSGSKKQRMEKNGEALFCGLCSTGSDKV